MSVNKRWRRVSVGAVALGIIAVGATACFAWLQKFEAIKQQRNAYEIRHLAATNSSNNLQGILQAEPVPLRAVSTATTVRTTLPIEQQRLVAYLRSQPKEGNAEKKAEARNQLTQTVELELTNRFAKQAAELEELEKRVVDAKSKLAQRRSRKQEIIDRRISELLNEPDELAWNANTGLNESKDSYKPSSTNFRVGPATGSTSSQTNPSLVFPSNTPHSSIPRDGILHSENSDLLPSPTLPEVHSAPISSPSLRDSESMGLTTPSPSVPGVSNPTPAEFNDQDADSAATNYIQNMDPKNFKARFGYDLDSLSNEAIEVDSDLEELDGLTASGKAETIQRLSIRKRIKQLELKLDEANKNSKRQQQSLQKALELEKKELDVSKGELENAKKLLAEGATSKSKVETSMLNMERAKFKVELLEGEQVASKEKLSSISDRVILIRKKLDEAMQEKAPNQVER